MTSYAALAGEPWWRVLLEGAGLFVLGGALLGVGRSVGHLERRFAAKVKGSVSEVEATGPFVLYLRPFIDDVAMSKMPPVPIQSSTVAPWVSIQRGRTDEEKLAILFSDLGRLVAVGRPDESQFYSGADRLYLPSGADWQAEVRRLMQSAEAVVIGTNVSEATLWEVATAFEMVSPTRLYFAVYNDENGYRQFQAAVYRTVDAARDAGRNIPIVNLPDYPPPRDPKRFAFRRWQISPSGFVLFNTNGAAQFLRYDPTALRWHRWRTKRSLERALGAHVHATIRQRARESQSSTKT
ncbi:hypothetical protein [Nocardia terpenica]|uniref:hypothetical protein n=1 Tax=Nocardia terpenica TaxID=455432 RepID=UPI002FE0EE61